MYNRYEGNTGRFVRVGTPEPKGNGAGHMRGLERPKPRESVNMKPPPGRGGGLGQMLPLEGIQNALSGILPKVLPDGLETDDLLLLLVLYLMYKESGDKELLIIMGAMFFL